MWGPAIFSPPPIFDVDQFEKFMKQVAPFRVPVIAEVMILRTAGMGKFLNRHFKSGLVPEWVIQKLLNAPDRTKASIELFADTVKSLKDICQGVHIITIGGEDKTCAIPERSQTQVNHDQMTYVTIIYRGAHHGRGNQDRHP